MKFINALQSEMLKSKRTASFYFTLSLAAIIPAILLLNFLTGGGDLAAISNDPLNSAFQLGTERTGIVFFPMFVILVCTLLPQIEYRNNTWKQVFAAPQTKGNVFLAKFIVINLFIVLFLVANLLFLSLVFVVMHFSIPSLNLLNQPLDIVALLVRTANSYVTMLSLCTFQFWLGMRYRNFIIPTGIGFALWITAMMMVLMPEFESGFVKYFPYSLPTLPHVSKFQPEMNQIALTALGYAMLFLLLGFLDFRKRRLTA
jgi:hypothetical protein